jgi:hypothetical protein
MMFLFLFFLGLACKTVAEQGDASAACAAVLQQGVYNIIAQDLNKNSYSQFQGVICTVSPNVTYSAYLDSANWDSWNSAASFFHITSDENSPMSESQFDQFQQVAASYQGSYCGFVQSNEGNSELFHQYIQTVNPEVYAAYQSCLSLYSTGIRFSSQFGFGSNSVFINVQFVSMVYGAQAMITGVTIVPAHTAACFIHSDSGPSHSTDFFLSLKPQETYSIACHSFGNDTATEVITVGISTTQGTYLTYLYNTYQDNSSSSSTVHLQAQIKQLANQVKHSQQLLTKLSRSINNNNNQPLRPLEISASSSSSGSAAPHRSSASAMDFSGTTVISTRNEVVSLSPTPLTVSVAETGVYLVAYNGRLQGIANSPTNNPKVNWWNVHLAHQRCGCDLSTAFGGQSEVNTGNYWIGSLTAGDVLEMKFFVNSDENNDNGNGNGIGNSVLRGQTNVVNSNNNEKKSVPIASADHRGVNSLNAVWLRPSLESESGTDTCSSSCMM